MEMQENANANINTNTNSLCRMGCGFFGSSNFDAANNVAAAAFAESSSIAAVLNSRTSSSTSDLTSPPIDVPSSTPLEALTATSVPIPINNSARSTTTSESDLLAAAATSSTAGTATLVDAQSEVCGSLPDDALRSSGGKAPRRNRCNVCRKKLQLAAIFDCRCGNVFCSEHRYSDQHECTFDYKAHGQELIKKANPQVIGDKLNKIS